VLIQIDVLEFLIQKGPNRTAWNYHEPFTATMGTSNLSIRIANGWSIPARSSVEVPALLAIRSVTFRKPR
jgi:hypothetical protein